MFVLPVLTVLVRAHYGSEKGILLAGSTLKGDRIVAKVSFRMTLALAGIGNPMPSDNYRVLTDKTTVMRRSVLRLLANASRTRLKASTREIAKLGSQRSPRCDNLPIAS